MDRGWGAASTGPNVSPAWTSNNMNRGWATASTGPNVSSAWTSNTDRGWETASTWSNASSAWTHVPSSTSSDTSWDKHIKKQKIENGGAQVDKGWERHPQVEKGAEQPLRGSYGLRGWRPGQQEDNEWARRGKRPLSSPLYGRGSPLRTTDDESAPQEMNRSPKVRGTFSDNVQGLQTTTTTENKNMVTERVLRIKLLIDSKAKRVLFAEAEKELVDLLFSLLTLPVSSIIEIITKKNMVGSMGNLFESVENISSSYLQPNQCKNALLKPKLALSAVNIPLLPPVVRLTAAKYYRCSTTSHHCYITNFLGTRCPCCGTEMEAEMSFVTGGYVKGELVMYLVSDDLVVMPMSTMSTITLLKKFNVLDVSFLEEKIIDFGVEEVLEVLKAALQSETVLTKAFLGKAADPEMHNNLLPLRTIISTEKTNMRTDKKLSLKILIDSKANRVVFAEAEKELIDFLFCLLAFPIAYIIELLTKKGMVGSIGNLYESVENISSTYIQPNLDKNSLLKPKVALSAKDIPLLPPNVGRAAVSKYYMCSTSFDHTYVTDLRGTRCPSCPVGNYQMSTEMSFVAGGTSDVSSSDVGIVRGGLVTYLVTDDLMVMPMSTISSITVLKKFNVGHTNILEEKIVDFGFEEGLELLKAALQSKNVLTEVFLEKKIKSEMQ